MTSANWGNAVVQQSESSPFQKMASATWLTPALSAGSHTVKVQWKTSTGTMTAGELGEESERTLTVVELR